MREKILHIAITIAISIMASNCIYGQKEKIKARDKERIDIELNYNLVRKMVHMGHYTFYAEEIRLLGQPGRDISSYYNEVTIDIYDVYAYLPNITRRGAIFWPEDSDYEVRGKLEKLIIEEKDARQVVRVKFNVTDRGRYQFSFTIFSNGYTNLNITTPRGIFITYSGFTEPVEPEKQEEVKHDTLLKKS